MDEIAIAEPCARAWEQVRSEEHTSELQSPCNLVCRLLLEKKKVTDLGHKPNVIENIVQSLWLEVHYFSLTRHILLVFFFFNDTATTEIYTLSLHDALPIWAWEQV